MEWLACIKSTIDYIEKNITTIDNIEEIASANYVSSFYLQQGFQVMTGYTIKEYVRNRRLYLAALDIVNHKKKIIDVAFSYCYDTQESFSKAFKRFHGYSPKTIKKEQIRIFNPLVIDIKINGGIMEKLNYKITNMFPFKLIGFKKQFTFDEAFNEIPKFWDEICQKYCYPRIYQGLSPINDYERAIIDNCIGEYGVCLDNDSNSFTYYIAGRYTGGNIPEGMEIIELEAGEYAVFDSVGPIPETLQNLTNRIFKEFLPLNKDFELRGNIYLEWYDCVNGEKTDSTYHSQIFLPIKRINK